MTADGAVKLKTTTTIDNSYNCNYNNNDYDDSSPCPAGQRCSGIRRTQRCGVSSLSPRFGLTLEFKPIYFQRMFLFSSGTASLGKWLACTEHASHCKVMAIGVVLVISFGNLNEFMILFDSCGGWHWHGDKGTNV